MCLASVISETTIVKKQQHKICFVCVYVHVCGSTNTIDRKKYLDVPYVKRKNIWNFRQSQQFDHQWVTASGLTWCIDDRWIDVQLRSSNHTPVYLPISPIEKDEQQKKTNCWWFRNPFITSWIVYPIVLPGFQKHPNWLGSGCPYDFVFLNSGPSNHVFQRPNSPLQPLRIAASPWATTFAEVAAKLIEFSHHEKSLLSAVKKHLSLNRKIYEHMIFIVRICYRICLQAKANIFFVGPAKHLKITKPPMLIRDIYGLCKSSPPSKSSRYFCFRGVERLFHLRIGRIDRQANQVSKRICVQRSNALNKYTRKHAN